MAGPFVDTFVEGSDALLENHVPTGTTPGTGWVNQDVGQITVQGATDDIRETNFSASNQYRMTSDLGYDEMDVQADFTELQQAGRAGLRVRLSASSVQGMEASYDHGAQQWLIVGGTTNCTLSQAWPGGTVTIKAEMRTGNLKLYGNGALKCHVLTNENPGNTYAGLTLLNFSGDGPAAAVDNFMSCGVTTSIANPLMLPVATTSQTPRTTAYAALNVPSLTAGQCYYDPTTGVKIYKLTDATFPTSSTLGFIHDYSEGSQEISLAHTGTTRTILVRDRSTNTYWLIDFTPNGGVSNARELAGNAAPTSDIRFTFSTDASTPYFAYCAHFDVIRRYDVRTLIESPGGGWPVTEPTPYEFGWPIWLQQTDNDRQFVWMLGANGPNVVSYIPATGTRVERSDIIPTNEPRLDRAGRYVAVVQNNNAMQLWDTQTNTLTWTLPGDPGDPSLTGDNIAPFGHAANLSRQFRGWDYNASFPYLLYKIDPSSATNSLTTLSGGTLPGVPQHSSGNWIQHTPLDDQWSLTHSYGAVTPAPPPSGSYLAPGAMVFVTANGQRRTLAHPYNSTVDASAIAYAKLSSDGKFVLFTSDMNGSGRFDLFLAEVPDNTGADAPIIGSTQFCRMRRF